MFGICLTALLTLTFVFSYVSRKCSVGRFLLLGSFLFMAGLTENLTLSELGLSFLLRPRPDPVGSFYGWVYMIYLEVLPGAAEYAGSVPFEP